MLLLPEGLGAGRRHAHTGCVLAARAAGRLPTRAEWRRGERAPVQLAGRNGSWWRRLWVRRPGARNDHH